MSGVTGGEGLDQAVRAPLDSDVHWVRWPAEDARRYLQAGYWTTDLLGDIPAEHARTRPDAPAVIDARTRLTYADLETQVAALAAGLHAIGLGRGDRAVVQLPNCTEFVVVVLGLLRAGLVPVMALPAHRRSEIASFVEQSDAALFVGAGRIGDLDQVALTTDLRRDHPQLRLLLAPDAATPAPGPAGGAGDRDHTLRQVLDLGRGLPPVEVDVRAGDLALLQLSGGSTGTPKLIPRTHRDYLYSVRESVRICGITAASVYLCALPCAHNFAMSSAGILGQLLAGGATVMAPDPGARTAFRLIREHGVTVSGVVPPVALLWLAAARNRDPDELGLSSLELLQVGGARLSAEAAAVVTPTLGCRLQQVFGMAEGLVNYTREDDPDEVVIGTQGRPISPDDEVRVVDDHDADVPDGTAGHLLTRGPYTIRGYYRAAEHNRRAFTVEGFYRTGDVVVRSATGHLTVVGRAKDQINRGGEKIAPEEVENHLLAHPGVHEAGVVGEPDDVLGERVVAYVVPSDVAEGLDLRSRPEREAARELRDHLRARAIATFKLPDQYHLVDTLPRTGVGKTSNARLRPRARSAS